MTDMSSAAYANDKLSSGIGSDRYNTPRLKGYAMQCPPDGPAYHSTAQGAHTETSEATLTSAGMKSMKTPLDAISSTKKEITIYTTIDDRKTQLKRRVQVVFLLTPAWCSSCLEPIVWKVIDFVPGHNIHKKLIIPPSITISTLAQDHNDVNIPHHFAALMPDTCIRLKTEDDNVYWEKDDSFGSGASLFHVRNNSIPQKLALCVHDDEKDISVPVVSFGATGDIKTGPPVMLEAYVTLPFKQGQIAKLDGKQSIIMEGVQKDMAIDLNMQDEFVFHLYCEGSGKPVLKLRSH